MEAKNREKLYLITAGVVAGLWLLDLLVISPLIDSWHGRSAEIAGLREKIANGLSLVRRDSTIRDRWDTMRANALANNTTAAEGELMSAFGKWVNSGGVTQGSFRPQISEGESNFTTVECRSEISGSPDGVKEFVRAMSKDPLADKVESFELTSKDDNGRQLALGLGLSGLILTGSDPSTVTLPPKTVEPPPPEDTNAASTAVVDPFILIARNNIFDQSRVYRPPGSPPRATRVSRTYTLTSLGSVIDHGKGSAFFEGTDVSSSKYYNEGAAVGDFKIVKITLKTVTLTNAGSNTFVLPTDGSSSLRRDDDGPWHPTDYVASVAAINGSPSTTASTTASISTAPASGSAADDIIAKLKKKREQE
jgi:hypothetical protein